MYQSLQNKNQAAETRFELVRPFGLSVFGTDAINRTLPFSQKCRTKESNLFVVHSIYFLTIGLQPTIENARRNGQSKNRTYSIPKDGRFTICGATTAQFAQNPNGLGGTCTHTPRRATDFESVSSANSVTRPNCPWRDSHPHALSSLRF